MTPDQEIDAVHIRIHGQVQGVWFRKWTVQEATARSLRGRLRSSRPHRHRKAIPTMPVREAWALNRVAAAYCSLENPTQACASVQQAMEIATLGDSQEVRFSCCNNLAYFWLRRVDEVKALGGDSPMLAAALANARRTAERALDLAREAGSPFQVAVALSNLINALLAGDLLDDAMPLLNEFGHIAHDNGYRSLAIEADAQRAVQPFLDGSAEPGPRSLADVERDDVLLRRPADEAPHRQQDAAVLGMRRTHAEEGRDLGSRGRVAKLHRDQRALGLGQGVEFGFRTIRAAVIDEDHFIAALQPIQRRVEPIKELLQAGFLVIDRNDDREFFSFHRART